MERKIRFFSPLQFFFFFFFLESGKWHTRGGIIINKISSVAKLLTPGSGALKLVPKAQRVLRANPPVFASLPDFHAGCDRGKPSRRPLPSFPRIIPHGFKEMNSRATRTRRFLKQILQGPPFSAFFLSNKRKFSSICFNLQFPRILLIIR